MSVNYKKENQTIVLLGKILTHISHTLSSLKSSSAINEDFEIEKQRRRRRKKLLGKACNLQNCCRVLFNQEIRIQVVNYSNDKS